MHVHKIITITTLLLHRGTKSHSITQLLFLQSLHTHQLKKSDIDRKRKYYFFY
jgi:hypothetical protein